MPEQIVKITELVELTDPVGGCLLPIVDISEPLEADQTKKIKLENLTMNLVTILQAVYPVGSIYISVISTNPATLFGFGTWSAFGAGRVLVGFDATQTEFDTALETGGAKTVTLTAAQMPVHTHVQNAHNHVMGQLWKVVETEASGRWVYTHDGAATTANTTATNQNAGSGQAHNNLQPYIVVYMWRRTA